MAKLTFTKMHGIGNDYIYVDCTQQDFRYDPAAVAMALSPRRFAVGADGLVLILPSAKEDFRMRIFNADGSEALACGNAGRCVAKYVHERGLTAQTAMTLETNGGVIRLELHMDEVRQGVVDRVTVDMGVASFCPEDVPALVEGNRWVEKALDFGAFTHKVTLLSVGNPHAVLFFDEDLGKMNLAELGPAVAGCDLFPQGINAEFVRVKSRDQLEMRVWERGTGETLACGSGACAAALAAMETNRCDEKVTVHLEGGDLEIERGAEGQIYQTGPASFSYDGSVDDLLWL